MKKKYLLPFVLALLFSWTMGARASSVSENKITDAKQQIINIKEKVANDKVQIKTEIASSTAEIKNIKQEFKSAAETRINKKLNEQKIKISDTFEKAIQNEKDLISRIDSRISKMAAENIDTASSTNLLEATKVKLASAETELGNLENLLALDIPTATSTQSSERKVILQNIKIQSQKTKTAIKTAHSAIIEVIASLKQGLMKQNSTSTITN